ncbi:monocarboxylate transporter 9-like [Convolutriloba macropyga]|uniref:monocarboxylate transporter 9-like n=1 Tax=Convolutriloba macropyga TaxID=536237 RepID=UPI003F522A97
MSETVSYLDISNRYPDGGYGWMIVLGGFMCNFFVDGTCYSFGLLLNDFKNEFGGTTFQTALAGSLCTGFYLIMGPVSSALENLYGARGVTVIGTIMASIGFILSTISPNITYFILCWGVLGGCGFGLVYLPSIVVASHWFQAKRGTAMGFIVSGSGMGASVMSKVVVFLFSTYDWRGVVWILVGLILNMVAMGTLFRPIRASDFPMGGKDESEGVDDDQPVPVVRNTYIADAAASNYDISAGMMYGSRGNITKSRPQLVQNKYLRTKGPCQDQHMRKSNFAIDTFRASNLDLRNRVMSERNLSPRWSRHNVSTGEGYYSIPDVTTQYEPVGNETNESETELNLRDAVLGPLKEMLDFSLLKRRSFSLLVFATVCTMMALFIPFVYLANYAESEAGVTRDESSTLMVILGLSNTFGRLLAGFLSDYSWVDALAMNNLALIIAGVCTMAVPLLKSYYLLIAYVIIFGCGIATFVCLRTIILDNIFGIEYLNNSFGIMLLFHGLAAVVGSPVAGMLFDYTGGYTYTFVLAGALLAFSGAICLPLKQLAAWEERSMKKESVTKVAEEPMYKLSSLQVDEVETIL